MRPSIVAIVRSIIVAVLFGFGSPALADAKSLFDAGKTAFEAGNYQQAVERFEAARAQGLDHPALYYNLGVSHYRLGNFETSRSAFRRLLDDPDMAPLAHYNLGLIADRQGQPQTARRHFQTVAETADDPKLVYLARRQLGEEAEIAGEAVEYDVRGLALISLGYDDNVKFEPTDVSTNQDDTFVKALVAGSVVVAGTRTDGVSLHGSYYLLDYQDLSSSDYSQIRVDLRKHQPVGDWQTYLGGLFKRAEFGNDPYQSIIGLEIEGEHPAGGKGALRLRYRYEDVGSLNSSYDYLEGSRQRARAEYRSHGDQSRWRVYYEFETNDREDTATESYSPTRHTFRGRYTRYLGGGWRWRGDAAYRISNYPSAPALEREDNRLKASLSVSKRFAKRWRVGGEYEYTNNDSNDPTRDYTRGLYSVSVRRFF